MKVTPTPTSGVAIQRYKIGYHADEWGQRSSTPSGIPDASGSWVRYADHVTALAAGQATAAQQGAYAALPESFLEIPDVQDESGINAYYSREVVLECIDAALASHGQAPAHHARITELESQLAQRFAAADMATAAAQGFRDGVASLSANAGEPRNAIDRDALIDAIAQGLHGTWHCTRVWEAWHVGTMSQDDFEPVDESETPTEIADAVLALLAAPP